jgi:hypothetical protein
VAPPVYSVRLGQWSLPAGATESYTVPVGHRAIIRDVSGCIFPGPATGTNFEFDAASTAIYVCEAPPSCSVPFHWEGRLVLDAGESFSVSNQFGITGARVDVAVSGYLLTLP